MNKYRVTIELIDLNNQYLSAQQLEGYLVDTITPALNALALHLTSSITTKKRGWALGVVDNLWITIAVDNLWITIFNFTNLRSLRNFPDSP